MVLALQVAVHKSGLSSGDWQAIAACVQAAAAVIALPYIALQLRTAKINAEQQSLVANAQTTHAAEQLSHQLKAIEGQTRAAEAAIYQGFTEIMIGVDRCFFECPELRPCFYSGQDLPETDPAYQKAVAVAEMFRDLEFHVARHETFLDHDVFVGWGRYFAFVRANSPIFTRFSSESDAWFVEPGATRTAPRTR